MKDHIQSFQLHIDDPCHESWEQMLPHEKGKFCLSCKKAVYDFTSKTKEEIIEFFQLRKFQPVCARVSNEILDDPGNNHQMATRRIGMHRLARFTYVLFIVFGNTLFSCNQPQRDVQDVIQSKQESSIVILEKPDSENVREVELKPAKKNPVKKPVISQDNNAHLYSALPDTIILPDIEVKTTYIMGNMRMGSLVITRYSYDWGIIDHPFPHSQIGKEEEEELDLIVKEPSIEIFPNPSSGQFQIRYELMSPVPVEMNLFNISGQFVQHILSSTEKSEGGYEESVQVHDLPAGIYFLRTIIGEKAFTRRLVIAK